jgi:hypothetical protein
MPSSLRRSSTKRASAASCSSGVSAAKRWRVSSTRPLHGSAASAVRSGGAHASGELLVAFETDAPHIEQVRYGIQRRSKSPSRSCDSSGSAASRACRCRRPPPAAPRASCRYGKRHHVGVSSCRPDSRKSLVEVSSPCPASRPSCAWQRRYVSSRAVLSGLASFRPPARSDCLAIARRRR